MTKETKQNLRLRTSLCKQRRLGSQWCAQGTVLGPLLFLVLLSDISTEINQSSVVSFADDTRLYRQINDINDCDYLQYGIDHVYT